MVLTAYQPIKNKATNAGTKQYQKASTCQQHQTAKKNIQLLNIQLLSWMKKKQRELTHAGFQCVFYGVVIIYTSVS